MGSHVLRIVADLGNSRIKLGRVDPSGRLAEVVALATDDRDAWDSAWSRWNPERGPSTWAIATVNPPGAARLRTYLDELQNGVATWFRSAADVPTPHVLENAQ